MEKFMDKFTAAQARKMMPKDNGVNQLLKDIHKQIKDAATLGMYEIEYKLNSDTCVFIRRKLRDTLREEGYLVSAPMMCNFMFISWVPR